MIKVMIVDDHQLLLDGIKSALEDVSDINVVAEAKNGLEVLEILKTKSVDVILMDINMPGMDGLDCTKIVIQKYPDIRILALSQYNEKRFIKQMLRNGAVGYMLKNSGREELIDAIGRVYNGGNFFSDGISINILQLNKNNTSKENQHLFPKLTIREKEVLNLICKGLSSSEIGEQLIVSFHTIETHRANLMSKSLSKNTAGLVRWALDNDLVD